jgi:hypothetical protein
MPLIKTKDTRQDRGGGSAFDLDLSKYYIVTKFKNLNKPYGFHPVNTPTLTKL